MSAGVRGALVIALLLYALPALAASSAARQGGAPAASAADPGFDLFVRRQAALEVQLGLRLYAAQDDYRAITALRRYQLLASSPEASWLAGLIIGQIYHRNDKHPQAALSFEQALLAAPSRQDQVWAYLLTVQQLCLPMSYYFECKRRLDEIAQVGEMTPQQRELIDYQRLYVEVVLRDKSVGPQRADLFSDPTLRAKALELVGRDRAFHELDLQRPWLAATLSAVLPGAGQLYNGRYGDAAASLGINALMGGLTYYAFAHADSVPLGVLSGVLTLGFYVGNITNAYADAQRLNAKTYQTFFEQLKASHWARVRFSVQDNQVGFGYAFDWPGEGAGQGGASAAPAPSPPLEVPPQPEPSEEMF